ncbi:MATE family efflux transporter [Salinisphaera aquimarina]|uniref:MATE family efflux transporter n=1 Tax=Salinisphaera aquimarina TaxID=2094031 RepID=A0ABV7EQG6_9GAMM
MSSAAATRGGVRLDEGSIPRHLIALSLPMVWGILAMIAYNVADTFFVARLGTAPLAALSFTFPVVMTVFSLALGLGIGTASVISRTVGRGDREEVRRLTTDSLWLSTAIVLVFMVAGLATIEPLFSLLGADNETLPLIVDYMQIWYLGAPFVIVPMIANNAMRACGNARLPSYIMIGSAGLNFILDPIFIFGLGPIPALGIQGAAIASLIARFAGLVLALAALHFQMQLIVWALPTLRQLLDSGRRVAVIALPAAATNMVNPIAVAVVTAVVAWYGPAAVAGFGVATRIEAISVVPLLALTAGLAPFIGQNWGASDAERVRAAMRIGAFFCLVWGLGVALLLFVLAPHIVALFNAQPATASAAVTYLRIVPPTFAAYGVLICVNAAFNAVGRPMIATLIMLGRTFGLFVPLAALGGWLFGLWAVFAAAALANLVLGITAYVIAQRRLTEV